MTSQCGSEERIVPERGNGGQEMDGRRTHRGVEQGMWGRGAVCAPSSCRNVEKKAEETAVYIAEE